MALYLIIFLSLKCSFVVVQSVGCVWLATPGTAAHQAPLSSTVSQSLLKFMSIELVMLSNHLIFCCPLLLLPSIFPSIRVFPMSQLFSSSGQSIGASASVLPVNIQGWFPLGLTGFISLQSKGVSRVFSSIVRLWSAFFMDVQLWDSYVTTGKTIALTIRTFVGKVMSLVFNMLSRFVVAFLPRRKHLQISWL